MYTRVYAESSPRKLVSGKGPCDESLSSDELLEEFSRHSDKYNEEPTRLVSVSSRIVDTLARACYKHYQQNEPAENVWIVFISDPADVAGEGDAAVVRHAEILAEYCGYPRPVLLRYEYLFEGSIPESLVVHRVSLKTLLDRGLTQSKDIDSIPRFCTGCTEDLRQDIAADIWHIATESRFWEVGIYLASFAQLFGARAPINWIAYQLLCDCTRCYGIHDDNYYRLEYHGIKQDSWVDLDDLKFLDDGVDTVLIDWWLTSNEFVTNYEIYEEERCEIEHNISVQIEEFYDTWYDEELDERQQELCDKAWTSLLDDIARQRAVVEREAVKMGL
jgi:hypothetical protein